MAGQELRAMVPFFDLANHCCSSSSRHCLGDGSSLASTSSTPTQTCIRHAVPDAASTEAQGLAQRSSTIDMYGIKASTAVPQEFLISYGEKSNRCELNGQHVCIAQTSGSWVRFNTLTMLAG